MFTQNDIKGTDCLDHLGLIAAVIHKLGISKKIDQLMPMAENSKTTHGQRAAAMIYNGLGFMDTRLYLFPDFLRNKPVEKLLGEGLKASDFNDDALGRFLDAVHEYGETKLFSQLALSIALEHSLLSLSAHFDTTSLSVYGDYTAEDQGEAKEMPRPERQTESERLSLDQGSKPEYGYAKNKRFDLKQMTLLLATTGAKGFPIWMESHHGNASDKKTLEEAASRMQQFCKGLESAPEFLFVGDSAMFSSCVKHGKNLLWLSRVPENIKKSKELLTLEAVEWMELKDGYKMHATEQEYGGVKQRWILIYSEQAYSKEIETLNKNIQKEYDDTTKECWHLGNQLFGCQKDIAVGIKSIDKKLKYHRLTHSIQEVPKYPGKGRPKKDAVAEKIEYRVKTILVQNEEAITNLKKTKGRFILATNQLDQKKLADHDVLSTYKENVQRTVSAPIYLSSKVKRP